jgi:thiamine-phosphate pyrophosphorylase
MRTSIVAEERGLYAIVDPEYCAGRDPRWVAGEILRGGCAALQLRAKQPLPALPLRELGAALLGLCRDAGVPFFVNDHVWLARELGAEGVHLGQADLPTDQARRELGEHALIGRSTHSLQQAQEAQAQGANLLGFGPIFATQTKRDADPVVGLEQLAEVCRNVRVPVIAIGGITLETAAEVARAGAAMAAAISAVCAVAQPGAAAEQLHRALGG